VNKDLTFEEALNELEEIVNSMERGEISLEEAIKAYERGTDLKNQCERRLKEAKMKVEKIHASKNKDDFSIKTELIED
tara:strand:- start:245 stop:478 length:234 start_codon:yes stop_codon:yes gene_type:complete